jgi:hypothetical protein
LPGKSQDKPAARSPAAGQIQLLRQTGGAADSALLFCLIGCYDLNAQWRTRFGPNARRCSVPLLERGREKTGASTALLSQEERYQPVAGLHPQRIPKHPLDLLTGDYSPG